MTDRIPIRRAAFALLALLTVNGAASSDELSPKLPSDTHVPDVTVSSKLLGQLAVAPTPRNFPNFDAADVQRMFEQAAELGRGAVFIYQWSDPELSTVPKRMTALAQQHKLTPIVGLSPTTLGQGRKELDVPAGLKSENRSFANRKLRDDFVRQAENLARLKPPYLCLATEINFLALQRLDEFLQFAALYKEAYRAVKAISPNTITFVSFQFEFIRIVDNKEPDRISEHAKLIDIFRPELDVVAITSYPASFYATPAELPNNYYAHLQKYLHAADKVLVMEIGWPSGGKSTPEMQQQFVSRLPALLAPIQPRVTAWSLLHDVKLAEFGDDLATTGLYGNSDDPKPAVELWRGFGSQSDRPPQR